MEVVDVEVAFTPDGVLTCSGGSVLSLPHAKRSAKSAAAEAKAIARVSIRINAVSGVRLVSAVRDRRGAASVPPSDVVVAESTGSTTTLCSAETSDIAPECYVQSHAHVNVTSR